MRATFILSLFSFMPMMGQASEQALQAGYISTTPRGWVQFCTLEPQDCLANYAPTTAMPASSQMFTALNVVNRAVNREIRETSDAENYGVEEYWSYPKNGRGDCEDFVLEKKRRLIAMGFPKSVLLLTIVRDRKNDGHAVLTVRTTSGDYILDNQAKKVKRWNETGYIFLKRQSEDNPNNWLALSPATTPLVASIRR